MSPLIVRNVMWSKLNLNANSGMSEKSSTSNCMIKMVMRDGKKLEHE